MVEGVEQACVRPGVVRGVETLLGGGVGVYLANEGEGSVEVSVPCDRTNGEGRRGCQSSARRRKRLTRRVSVRSRK